MRYNALSANTALTKPHNRVKQKKRAALYRKTDTISLIDYLYANSGYGSRTYLFIFLPNSSTESGEFGHHILISPFKMVDS